MGLLQAASSAYGYNLNLSEVARIWRGGCIIRSALLEDIRLGSKSRPDVPNLLVEPRLYREAASRRNDLQAVVGTAASLGNLGTCDDGRPGLLRPVTAAPGCRQI